MVIQRWQSVWLLIAAILMAVFCFVPMALVPAQEFAAEPQLLHPTDIPVFFVINIVVAVLLLLAIFLYKNTRRQKQVTLVSILLIVVMVVTECILLFSWDTTAGRVEWLGSVFLMLGALVFAAMAYRGITNDEKLLKAADRLR